MDTCPKNHLNISGQASGFYKEREGGLGRVGSVPVGPDKDLGVSMLNWSASAEFLWSVTSYLDKNWNH